MVTREPKCKHLSNSNFYTLKATIVWEKFDVKKISSLIRLDEN